MEECLLQNNRGIKNLVAAAVPKLKLSNVMLIDSDGVTLGDNDEMAQMSELSIAQQKYKIREEKKKQKKLLMLLPPLLAGEIRLLHK